MKKLLLVSTAMLICTAAQADIIFTVPTNVSEGHMNMRDGPGSNHALIGAIPGGAVVSASRCVPRDDGIAGANWCLVTYGMTRGWVSQAGLMPGGASTPSYYPPVPSGTVIQGYSGGEPPYRGGPVSPDYSDSYAMQGIQPPVPMTPIVTEGQQEFVCVPGYDKSDHNPPTNIVVDVMLNHGVATNMEVAFDLRGGERVYRSRQYRATIPHDSLDHSVLASWRGTRVANPHQTMAGGLYYGRDNQWHYREKQWNDSRVEWDYTAPCRMVDLP